MLGGRCSPGSFCFSRSSARAWHLACRDSLLPGRFGPPPYYHRGRHSLKNGARPHPGTATLLRLLTLEAPVAAGWDGRPAGRAPSSTGSGLPGGTSGFSGHCRVVERDSLPRRHAPHQYPRLAEIPRQDVMPPDRDDPSKSVNVDHARRGRLPSSSRLPAARRVPAVPTSYTGFLAAGEQRPSGRAPTATTARGPADRAAGSSTRATSPAARRSTRSKIVEYHTQRAAWAAMMRADANMLPRRQP